MDHNEIRHRLSEYIDDSVTVELKSEIEAHLRTCPDCSEAFRELQKTIEHIKIVEDVEPPAWMAQKIMAEVRSAETEKKSLLQKHFFPVHIKIPLQAVAVLLLAVGAFYIYRSIEPPSRTGELPTDHSSTRQHAANPELPLPDRTHESPRREENSTLPSPRVPQSPAYKSLDMKPEYAAPSLPVHRDEEKAPASDKTKRAKQTAPAGESMLMGKLAPPPRKEVEQRSLALAGKTMASAEVPDSTGSSTSTGETEAVLLKNVIDFFINHDLPRNGDGKNIKYDVSKFQAPPVNASWLDEGMQKKLSSCKNTFLADVQVSETQLKYVYCADNASIELLFKVVQKKDRWIKTD